jgi:hypothetical protein
MLAYIRDKFQCVPNNDDDDDHGEHDGDNCEDETVNFLFEIGEARLWRASELRKLPYRVSED